MGILDHAVKGLGAIVPPDESKPEAVRRWRWAMFIVQTVILVLLSLHLSASKGLLEPIGIFGFALHTDVEEIRESQSHILYGIYAPLVRAKVRERCTASPGEREQINRELDRILDDFKDATGKDFRPMPTCGDV